MEQILVNARKREVRGKGAAGRLRREGRIPGIVYGRGIEPISIEVDEIEILKTFKNVSESTIIKIDVEGTEVEAFVKETKRNIVNGKLLHIDFYAIARGQLLRTNVPLVLTGTPVGVLDGGTLEQMAHVVEVECLPRDLPESIEVDISALKEGEAFRVLDIVVGEGVTILSAEDQQVASVRAARAIVEDEELDEGMEASEEGEGEAESEDESNE